MNNSITPSTPSSHSLASTDQKQPSGQNNHRLFRLLSSAIILTSPIKSLAINPARTPHPIKSNHSAIKGSLRGSIYPTATQNFTITPTNIVVINANQTTLIEQEWSAFKTANTTNATTVLTLDGLKKSSTLSQLISHQLGYDKVDNYLNFIGRNKANKPLSNHLDQVTQVTLSAERSEIELSRLTEAANHTNTVLDLSNGDFSQLSTLKNSDQYVNILLADNHKFNSERPCRQQASITVDGPEAGRIATLFMEIYQFGNNPQNNFQAQIINLALSHGGTYPIHTGTLSGTTLGYNLSGDKTRGNSGIYLDPDNSANELIITLVHEIAHDLHTDSRDISSLYELTHIFHDTGTVHSREQVAFLAGVMIAMYDNGVDYRANIDFEDYSADLFLVPRFTLLGDGKVDGDYRSLPPEAFKTFQKNLDQLLDKLNDKESNYFSGTVKIADTSIESAYELYNNWINQGDETITLTYTNPGDNSETFTHEYNVKELLMQHLLMAYQNDLFFPTKIDEPTYFDHDPRGTAFLKTGVEQFVSKLIEEEGDSVKASVEKAAAQLYLSARHLPFTHKERIPRFDAKLVLTPAVAFLLGLGASKLYEKCCKTRSAGRRRTRHTGRANVHQPPTQQRAAHTRVSRSVHSQAHAIRRTSSTPTLRHRVDTSAIASPPLREIELVTYDMHSIAASDVYEERPPIGPQQQQLQSVPSKQQALRERLRDIERTVQLNQAKRSTPIEAHPTK